MHCTYSHGAQMMNPNKSGDLLIFHLAPAVGQGFHSSSEISTKWFT